MSSSVNLGIWRPPLTGSGDTKFLMENQRTSLLSMTSSKTRSAPNTPCFATVCVVMNCRLLVLSRCVSAVKECSSHPRQTRCNVP